jgi:hypothetical protein
MTTVQGHHVYHRDRLKITTTKWSSELGRRIETNAREFDLFLEIDLRWIAEVFGNRAARNKSGKSKALNGAVKISAKPVVMKEEA